MPTNLGLYTRAELRTLIRRKLDTYRPGAVGQTTGTESGTAVLDPLITNEDLNPAINTALTNRSLDLSFADETILSDVVYIDIVEDKVEYEMPEDLVFLREVRYLPTGVTYDQEPPSERRILHQVDDAAGPLVDPYGTPTFYRRLNLIVLNSGPTESIPGGLEIYYVKWLQPLLDDGAVIETQFARLLQELVIVDVTISMSVAKLKIETPELRAEQVDLFARLQLAVRNASMPRAVSMVPHRPILRDRRSSW